MSPHRRGISTVIDVTLCLALVSVAVLTIAVVAETDDADPRPERAERTAELLGTTTTSVEYSVRPVTAHDEFDDAPIDTKAAYERTDHGPVAGLLASAAVTNAQIDGYRLTRAGEDYEVGLDGVLSETSATVDGNVHVTAVWQPYEDSSIRGEATAGPEPPAEADVSSATMTVASGVDEPDKTELREAYAQDYETLVRVVASAVVEGYFPPEETQLALERQGVERQLIEYRYRRAVAALDGIERYDIDDEISRSDADATEANREIAAVLAEEVVAGELSDALDDEIDRSAETNRSDPDRVARATDDLLTSGEVTIVVRTWVA